MKETKDEYIKRMTSGFEDDWGKSTYKYEMVQKIPYTNPEKYLEQIEQVLKMETSNKMKIDVIKQTIQTYKGELKVFDF